MRAGDVVVLAVVADRAAPYRPGGADDVDGLRQRVDALTGRQLLAAVGRDRVPERARAKAELDPAAAEDVQRRHAPGQHDWRAQRQVGHVRRHPDVGRLGSDDRKQRPRVQELGLVRVVLEGDEVQPDDVGEASQLKHRRRLVGGRRDEDSELEVVSIVGHAVILARDLELSWASGSGPTASLGRPARSLIGWPSQRCRHPRLRGARDPPFSPVG